VVSHRINRQETNMEVFLTRVRRKHAKLCVIDIGSGTAIPTCREQAETVASDYGASFIRINPREAFLDSMVPTARTVSLPLGAADAIARIDAELKKLAGVASVEGEKDMATGKALA